MILESAFLDAINFYALIQSYYSYKKKCFDWSFYSKFRNTISEYYIEE